MAQIGLKQPNKWTDIEGLPEGTPVGVRWAGTLNPETGRYQLVWKRGFIETNSVKMFGPKSVTVVFVEDDEITGRMEVDRLRDLGIPETDHADKQRRLG